MEAKDLMQFDWICLEDDPTPRQVDFIRSGEVGLFWNKIVTPPYIKPILITPEILEKNGWKCECFGGRQEWWLDKTKFPIVRYSINGTLHHNEIVLIFVHQLQHALKLCGIDKEIEL